MTIETYRPLDFYDDLYEYMQNILRSQCIDEDIVEELSIQYADLRVEKISEDYCRILAVHDIEEYLVQKAHHVVDQYDDLPDSLKYYFDYKKLANDLEMDMTIFTIDIAGIDYYVEEK